VRGDVREGCVIATAKSRRTFCRQAIQAAVQPVDLTGHREFPSNLKGIHQAADESHADTASPALSETSPVLDTNPSTGEDQ
jgi:hypothetical protein